MPIRSQAQCNEPWMLPGQILHKVPQLQQHPRILRHAGRRADNQGCRRIAHPSDEIENHFTTQGMTKQRCAL